MTLEEPNIDAPGQSGDLDKPSEGDKSYVSSSLLETESLSIEDPSSSGQSIPTRNISRNGNPRVPNEDLVCGATFIGIVRRIQSFRTFFDFGALMDGLVHVSKCSDISLCTHHEAFHKDLALHHLPRECMKKITRF